MPGTGLSDPEIAAAISVNSGVSETILTWFRNGCSSGLSGTDLTRSGTTLVNSRVSGTGLTDPRMDAEISIYSGVSETSLTGDSTGGTGNR